MREVYEKLKGARLLIVDDDAKIIEFFVEFLEEAGVDVVGVTEPAKALRAVERAEFDLVLADVEMPAMRGPELMKAIHGVKPALPVILMTAFGSIDRAVESLRQGAVDFLPKPFPPDALLFSVERALRERTMRHEIVRLHTLLGEESGHGLVAKSEAMQEVMLLAKRAAMTDSPILITGESGVGKSALAAAIHGMSRRKGRPFVRLNCAALPVSLAESELFGSRRGAFTGATENRRGIFVEADGGSLLLDEVGELPLEIQPKLLEVLETGLVRPLGGERQHRTDVRLISATNRDLDEAMQEKRFREDLYYRLHVIRIEVPPLRERLDDIPALVEQFLRRARQRTGRPIHGLSRGALERLVQAPWLGNVRELANAVERAVVMAEHDHLVEEDFAFMDDRARGGGTFEAAVAERRTLAEMERIYIEAILGSVEGNKREAAKILGIDRRTLYRKLDVEPA